MSNEKWRGEPPPEDKVPIPTNQNHRSGQANAGEGEDEEEEFGEFEGYEGANNHFEGRMAAQPLPESLQAGMASASWSSFPDYVPSQQHAASSTHHHHHQPDLLPMTASQKMPDSSGLSGASGGGGAMAPSFALPDISPQQAPGPSTSHHHHHHHPNGGSIMNGTSSSSASSSSPANQVGGFGSSIPSTSQNTSLAFPDVSCSSVAQEGPSKLGAMGAGTQRGSSAPDVGSGACHGGAMAAELPKSGYKVAVDGSPTGAKHVNGLMGHREEQQLASSRLLNQRLTNEVEQLQQRVSELEEELTRVRIQCTRSDVESIVQEALQRQRNCLTEAIQEQVGQLVRRNHAGSASTGLSEERLQQVLSENNQKQLSTLDETFSTFATQMNELIHTSVQSALSNCADAISMPFDAQSFIEKMMEQQSKRDAEIRGQMLSCFEAIFNQSTQQIRNILQPNNKKS